MTNEEKAEEIAISICGEPSPDDITGEYPCAEDAALEMAEWKDDTVRDIIKKEIDRANRYYDQKLFTTQMAASIRVVSVLSKLIGEKFPYDELHMGFATMD